MPRISYLLGGQGQEWNSRIENKSKQKVIQKIQEKQLYNGWQAKKHDKWCKRHQSIIKSSDDQSVLENRESRKPYPRVTYNQKIRKTEKDSEW